MTYRLNKKQIKFFNNLELKKELKEISSDYNISFKKVLYLYSIYNCTNEITSYLDENLI